MADETPAGAQPAEKQPPRMQILGQYIRDMSFENIMAQKGGAGNAQPDFAVQVNLDARKRPQENQYEILLKLNVEAQVKDAAEKLFILEIEYGGLFQVENVPEDQLHPYLLIECPRMLFPYVRRIVGDVTRDGGFPPLNLDNIDFLALYRENLARRAVAEKEGQPVS